LRKGIRPGQLILSTLPLGLEPPIANRFLFEVEDVEIGVFREVRGLELTIETVPVVEGGQNGFVHKLPGRMTWPNIVFKRGLMQSDALFSWVKKTSGSGFAKNDNQLERQWAAIVAIDSIGIPLRAWTLRDAYPVRWKGPDFSTDNYRTQLEEELEIAHHGFSSTTFGLS
jgi:phage tail-like protein